MEQVKNENGLEVEYYKDTSPISTTINNFKSVTCTDQFYMFCFFQIVEDEQILDRKVINRQ